MVDWLPTAAQKAVLFLPMVHGVELVRQGYFGSLVRTHYDMNYFVISCLCLTILAFSQERYVSKRVIPE
jgi:ABC-type polysaccharide/polyol phosphate export permease